MAIKDVLKVNRKTFLHPTRWLGYDNLKNSSQAVWGTLKGMFIPARPTRQESFKEAMKRLKLTEEDIAERMKTYLTYSYVFLALGLFVFILSFLYLFYYHTFGGWLLALSVSAFCLAQAFRYNFWYFQMKHRKLGCTFDEWRQGKISRSEETKS